MMRSVYMLPGLILMLAFAGAIVVSCSLASYQPQFVVTVSAAQTGRSGPALSQMSHYILAVSGPNTNSLNDSDVQGRSLDCLGLKGQVFFPLTYSQLLSGVQASLALGDYQFTLIGFDGSAVASPASVAELVGGSPNLKAYRLAQASASIGKSQTLELAPAYDAASAPDLLTQCPKAAYSLHALLEKSSQVFYFTNSSGSWVANQVDPLGGQNLGSLYVDASAKAHVTYGTTGTSVGVRYSTNSSGTFSPRAQVATSGQTGGFDYSAIVLDKLNTPIVLSNDSTLGSGNVLGKTYENQGSGFILGSSVFTDLVPSYRDFSMTVRTSGEIAVVGTGTNSGAPMYVSARSVGGIWSPITVVNTAIPQTCSVGSVGGQVQYDPNGFIHAIFRCEGASSAFLGYVTNRTGSWVTQSLDSLNSGNGLVSFNIDPTGKMHVVYTNSTLLVYLTGDSANSTFASPQTIVSTVTSFTSQVIAARGASDVWILVSELSGGAVFLSQYHKDSGGFFNHTSIGSYPTGTVFLSRLYAQ